MTTGPDALLDLFSTSPTKEDLCFAFCSYRAPLFAYQMREKAYGIVQGCCNHWDCPRCGILRAKHEYGRIVNGCRILAKDHDLYFITVTCRGKELDRADAEKNYLVWTNRLLDALRADAKRRGLHWCYVQVTERQSRGHPHSHLLAVWYPKDLSQGKKRQYVRDNTGALRWENVPVLRSEYLQQRVISAGLGDQYDISKVDTVEGASRYVAKYMFKPEMFSGKFPPYWKRVRYSQNFPKLPEKPTDAFVLLSRDDWSHLASVAVTVHVQSMFVEEEAMYFLKGNDILIERDVTDVT